MRKKRWKHILVTAVLLGTLAVFTAGCKQESDGEPSKSYYVISEELDVKKTVDKAQDILENAPAED